MARQKRAFTLIEVILVVLFLGIMAAIAIPRLSLSTLSKQEADCLAKKIVTDLRRTRQLAISDAANNTDGFALNMTGGSPYTGYEIEDLSTSTIITNGTFSIDSAISCTGEANFQFGPLGNLLSESDAQLVISVDEKTFTIDVTSATGMVKCTEN